MLNGMRTAWISTTLRGIVIALLIVVILGITLATMMPAIYRSEWFQKNYVNTSK